MRLSFVAVTTDQQFRDLLHVRNECREGLTHDTHELTLSDQWGFKQRCWPQSMDLAMREGFKPQLWYEPYLLMDEGWPVGYGLLKWDDNKYWMTIGLVKAYRGKGLSRLLINYITEMGHREGAEVWLDVLNENRKAYEGYLKAGYKIVEYDALKHDTLITVMRHTR